MPGAQIIRGDAKTIGELCIQVGFVIAVDRTRQPIQLVEDGEEFVLIQLLQGEPHVVIILKADAVSDVVAQFYKFDELISHVGPDLLAGFPRLMAQAQVI